MENKKIDVLFGVVVIAFLLVTIILIKDFNSRRVSDYKEFKAVIINIVRMKNDKIRMLAKENQDLRNTLTSTRNDLDALTKKLTPPAPVAVPVAASAPVAATK